MRTTLSENKIGLVKREFNRTFLGLLTNLIKHILPGSINPGSHRGKSYVLQSDITDRRYQHQYTCSVLSLTLWPNFLMEYSIHSREKYLVLQLSKKSTVPSMYVILSCVPQKIHCGTFEVWTYQYHLLHNKIENKQRTLP